MKDSYAHLAPLYDWVMSHVDYAGWADFVRRVLQHHRHVAGDVLEVAGGTGQLFENLELQGQKTYICSDLSLAMLQAMPDGFPCERVVADMRELPFVGRFDTLLCLYDSINYMMNSADFLQALQSFSRACCSGAVAIFDVTTEFNSRTWFDDVVDTEELEDCTLIRRSFFEESDRIQNNYFTFFHRQANGLYDRVDENHQQRIWSVEQITGFVAQTDWEILGVYDGFTLDPAEDTSERIHFVLRKA